MSSIDPIAVPQNPLLRPATSVLSPQEHTSFVIKPADRSYKHQYANIYFVRLRILRQFVERRARKRWSEVAGDPVFVPRVLDVVKGQLCFIIGTVYMDMPLKPNVLEDIARDHSLPAPPPREKYYSEDDSVMLEDESGRVNLVGERIRNTCLVTGVILGALGIETNSGEFEVVDLCFAGMAPQPGRGIQWPSSKPSEDSMDVDTSSPSEADEWVGIVSGLEVGASSPADGEIQLLAEYLSGEAGDLDDQTSAARISRLIIAGNSLAAILSITTVANAENERRSRRYGNDNPNFSTHPTRLLANCLADIARSMPIHILPGPSDPAGAILPQQPLPRAMLGAASSFSTFSSESNPCYIRIAPSPADSPPTTRASQPNASTSKAAKGKANKTEPASPNAGPSRMLLVHSGQPIDDMFRYVATPPISRLALAEHTLRWRHIAPTAPDTLWCHPYLSQDPFMMQETPDLYVVGNQPRFATSVVEEADADESEGEDEARGARGKKRCRIVLVPGFRESGVLVLVNLRTMAVKRVQFGVHGMSRGGGET